MSSKWPDLKREMDKIPVPVEKLDSIITNTINENRVKKSKKKIATYSLSVAVLIFGIFVGSAIHFPVMAKVASQIPIIGTFFNDIDDVGLQIAGQKGLTQVVEQASKDNGITLTINEIFYDGTRLTLGYTQESLFAIGDIERPNIEVNGKEINFSSSYFGDFVTPQKYKGVIDINPTEELPEEFKMKITIDAVGFIPGRWEFEFPVKQSNKVTVIRPEEVKVIEQAEVQITSLKIGSAGTDLTVKVTMDEENNRFDPHMLDFYVIDENGKMLDTVNKYGYSETENGKVVTNLEILYTPLQEEIKKLQLIPYNVPITEQSFKEVSMPLDEQSTPFALEQGDFGKALITDITYQDDGTIVHFEIQSDATVDNRLTYNPIWLEDAKGNILTLEDQPFPERLEGNRFKQQFSASKKDGLMLKTYKSPKPITYEPFEIEISGLSSK